MVTASTERTYRYERKFLVERLDHHQAILLIKQHPYLFYQPYPPRHINNFYLDTAEMKNYYDNVSGAGDRRKVRLRWYGQLFGQINNSILEIKIKRGLVGTKHQVPFGTFILENGYSIKDLRDLEQRTQLPKDIQFMLQTQEIVLLNRYYRYYFATHDNRFRLTVDTDLQFYRIGRFNNQFAHTHKQYHTIIVELKYQNEYDLEAQRVSSFFPFRITRSSKYVEGINRTYF